MNVNKYVLSKYGDFEGSKVILCVDTYFDLTGFKKACICSDEELSKYYKLICKIIHFFIFSCRQPIFYISTNTFELAIHYYRNTYAPAELRIHITEALSTLKKLKELDLISLSICEKEKEIAFGKKAV